MKKVTTLFLFLITISTSLFAQIERMEPPNWWTDMPVNEVQLMLYGEDLGLYRATLDYPGVSITKQLAVDSPNYLVIYLSVDEDVEAGTLNFNLKKGRRDRINVEFPILERESREGKNMGFDSSDLIYLIMPDRFANGDTENDNIPGMLETVEMSDPERRQGGDLEGVRQHLDYIKDLGMTSVWLMPIFENDMTPEYGGYHGYAATDFYQVDRRLGTNAEYKALVEETHAMGMKSIMDMIHNHIGDQHWWMKDLPTKDWVHSWEKNGQTNYRGPVASDPYASEYDLNKLNNGWFVKEMPDLNQNNELLSDYLIQNTIWWIEYSGVDGIRMDTHVYPDKDYMALWAKTILKAYPDMNIIGEAWLNFPGPESFWQEDKPNTNDGYNSYLPNVTEFPFAMTIDKAFNENFGWDTGLSQLWNLFTNDFLYSDPMKNVTFMDNHDMDRIYERLGRNKEHFKMAYAFLVTTRGIPQVYYGTEVMMKHDTKGGDDDYRRPNMPGGWPNDTRSVFTEEGRTDEENEIIEYTTTLNEWRKTAVAVHEGKLTHFVPNNGVYVYFRTHEDQNVMVVMNSQPQSVTLPQGVFSEILNHFSSATNVVDGSTIDVTKDFEVPGKATSVWELK